MSGESTRKRLFSLLNGHQRASETRESKKARPAWPPCPVDLFRLFSCDAEQLTHDAFCADDGNRNEQQERKSLFLTLSQQPFSPIEIGKILLLVSEILRSRAGAVAPSSTRAPLCQHVAE